MVQLISTLLSVLPLLAVSSAQNVDATSQKFVLKTKLVPGSSVGNKDFGGLYLSGYHSGAGTNDAVLLKDKKTAADGYLNSTNVKNGKGDPVYSLHFVFQGSDLPYSLEVVDSDFYAEWLPVAINGGNTGPKMGNGYFFNASGLQGRAKHDDFGGWLVCNWWRGVPQLFALRTFFDHKSLPSSCERVNLIREQI